MFRVIIAGSRKFLDYPLLKEKCDLYLKNKDKVVIVSGGARGADQLGEQYADETGYDAIVYEAEWDKYGKSAGYKRNELMAQNADALIAFWDGESRGTMHMINLAKKHGLAVRVVQFNN